MIRHPSIWHLKWTWVSTTLVILVISGCGRSGENVVDETEPTPDVVAAVKDIPPVSNSRATTTGSPGVALATSNSTSTSVKTLAAPTTPAAPTTSTAPFQIGRGHFHGSRETMVFRSPGVRSLAISPDGRFLAVGRQLNQRSGALQLWDVAQGRLIRETFEPLGVTAVAFAPDSQSVAHGAGDHSVVWQSISAGHPTRWEGHALWILDLAFSPDGKRLASVGFDKRLILWDIDRGSPIAEAIADAPRPASSVRFTSPDRLCTWSVGALRWYDISGNSPELVPRVQQDVKLPDDFGPVESDGDKLYGLRHDHTLQIVDVATGQDLPTRSFDTQDQPDDVDGASAARHIAAIAVAAKSRDIGVFTPDGLLTLWERGDPTAHRAWNIHANYVSHLVADDQGRFWAAQAGGDGLVVIDRENPDSPRWLERTANEPPSPLIASKFNTHGETIVSIQNSGNIIRSQINTGQTIHTIKRGDPLNSGEVSVLGTGREDLVLCGTSTGHVEFWKPGAITPASIFVAKTPITALAETPDGKHLLVGDAEGGTTWVDSRRTDRPLTRREQTARIRAAATSPDGRWAATASDDQTVVLWEVARQAKALKLQGHKRPLTAVAFSPDSKWLVSGDQLGTVVVWDVPAGNRKWSVTLPASLTQSQHRSKEILADTNRTASSQSVVAPMPPASGNSNPNSTNDAADSSQGSLAKSRQLAESAATPFKSNTTSDLFNVFDSTIFEARQMLSNLVNGGVSAFAISRDQRVLAVGTASGYTQTFDLRDGTELSVVYHHAPISDLAFAEDGASLLVAKMAGDVSRWWQAPSTPRPLLGHQGSVRFAALDATGQRAVTGGLDKRLCVWDVGRGTLSYSIDNEGEAIVSGALSSDGLRAVTGGYGSGVVFWDLVAMKRLAKSYGHGKRVLALAFSSDGKWVASGCADQTVRVWDFATQKTKSTIPHDAPVQHACFSPDGSKLLTSTIDPRGWQFASRLRLWETTTGKPVIEFKGHRVVANSAVFSPDGTELTSCGADGQLYRWNVSNGQRTYETFRSDGLSHAGLINGGRSLVMRRFNRGVIIQSMDSMSRLSEFDVPTRSVGDLNVASMGNRIIAGTEEGPVYVWSMGHE